VVCGTVGGRRGEGELHHGFLHLNLPADQSLRYSSIPPLLLSSQAPRQQQRPQQQRQRAVLLQTKGQDAVPQHRPGSFSAEGFIPFPYHLRCFDMQGSGHMAKYSMRWQRQWHAYLPTGMDQEQMCTLIKSDSVIENRIRLHMIFCSQGTFQPLSNHFPTTFQPPSNHLVTTFMCRIHRA